MMDIIATAAASRRSDSTRAPVRSSNTYIYIYIYMYSNHNNNNNNNNNTNNNNNNTNNDIICYILYGGFPDSIYGNGCGAEN